MQREAETLSKRHACANCLLEIVAFVFESLKTSNFASNLPASKSKFQYSKFRYSESGCAHYDFKFGANDVTVRYSERISKSKRRICNESLN